MQAGKTPLDLSGGVVAGVVAKIAAFDGIGKGGAGGAVEELRPRAGEEGVAFSGSTSRVGGPGETLGAGRAHSGQLPAGADGEEVQATSFVG